MYVCVCLYSNIIIIGIGVFVLHFLFLYYSIHRVVNWQVFKVRAVSGLVENYLKFVIHCIWNQMLLRIRPWRRWKQGVYSNPKSSQYSWRMFLLGNVFEHCWDDPCQVGS